VAVLIATLEQSLLRWRVVSEFWRDALLGLLILLAVATDSVVLARLRLLWARVCWSSLRLSSCNIPGLAAMSM
jgi:hypothetical protein